MFRPPRTSRPPREARLGSPPPTPGTEIAVAPPRPRRRVDQIVMAAVRELLEPTDTFARRHLGDDAAATAAMLAALGYATVEALADAAVPAAIRRGPLQLPAACGESDALAELR